MKSTYLLHLAVMLVLINVGCELGLAKASEPIHDVAITNVSVPSNCTQGESVRITVSIANQGTRRETFRVTLIEDTSSTDTVSKEVTLAKGWSGPSNSSDYSVFQVDGKEPSHAGSHVCMNGDVNGDCFMDIMISDPEWNDRKGRVFFYYGRKQFSFASPDIVLLGEKEGDHFGGQSSTFSDLNNDGYDDMLIGSPGWAHDKRDGFVRIYYGGPSMDNIPDVVLVGEAGQESRFGMSIDTGDVDNDGYEDVIVGAQTYDQERGRAYLFWGGNPMDRSPDVIFEGEGYSPKSAYETLMVQGWFGRRIDASGDVNGDGYNDILIGARHAGKRSEGSAYLFFGNKREIMDVACDFVFRGNSINDNMGSSLDLFDIDNDGFSDVIVGARYAKKGHGAVYLWWGGKDFDGNRPADVVLEGEPLSNMGGDDIACGYFNDDRYGDILVGAYNYPRYPVTHGRAYVFFGSKRTSIDADCDRIFDPQKEKHYFLGVSVCSGDVNQDGYDDALIGGWGNDDCKGKSFLYFGPFSDITNITFNWDTTNATPGKHILKASIAPVAGEEDVADNTMTVTVEVKEERQ